MTFEVIVLDRDLSIGAIWPALARICALKRAIRAHRRPHSSRGSVQAPPRERRCQSSLMREAR
jgi:hypothetical protein